MSPSSNIYIKTDKMSKVGVGMDKTLSENSALLVARIRGSYVSLYASSLAGEAESYA
jgi:hypothetical protein